MKIRVAALAIGFAASRRRPRQAQLRGGTVEINPFAGWLFGGNFGNADVEFTPSDSGSTTISSMEAASDTTSSSLFEFEFEYAYFKTQFDRRPGRHLRSRARAWAT